MAASDPAKKDFKEWFDHEAATAIAAQIVTVFPSFDRARFTTAATSDLELLEMSQRVAQFTEALRGGLPDNIEEAIDIIIRSLPPAWSDCETISGGWNQWPLAHFIATYGREHYEQSLTALTEITMRFTSEFAIRPFIVAYPEQTLRDLLKLTTHENPHVRRWCSEGSRPRLPWGQRLGDLVADPTPLWPILDALHDDPELYVRRSVANNLNDIAKDHPDAVIAKCAEWKAESESAERLWMIRHALRTLVKAGHSDALALLGYGPPENISADLTLSTDQIAIGDSLEMRLTVTSRSHRPQDLIIDYAVHYLRANGSHSAKVFKWKTLTLPEDIEIDLRKKQSFRTTTIRALYPGEHRIEVFVNGFAMTDHAFQLGA